MWQARLEKQTEAGCDEHLSSSSMDVESERLLTRLNLATWQTATLLRIRRERQVV
jgi:hypothetical protein